ncbi:helix-turn-helix domain-containing protein [Leifsonia sp. F6_8S_P_1B]|uniref:Helix-turn-helix domain-containing protein n=1 Tax=Leifsonia williamsii TaxID=3035919 RepID=A0ABT8K7S1_9MICO|nr:helix-turn-helix domain-containing protein [Leifsonia williamsii]MDN4613212.1 helix-turn-helix domain-containing protein [Leifsonia williamsii]
MILEEDVRTADPGEAAALIGRMYRRVRLIEGEGPFAFRQAVFGDDRVTVARFDLSSQTEAVVDFEVLSVGERAAGSYRATTNGDEIPADGPFLFRPGEVRSWSDDLRLTLVNLRLDVLAHYATGDGGSSARLRFENVAPVSPTSAEHWRRVSAYGEQVLTEPELLHNDLIRTATSDALYVGALTSFAIVVAGAEVHDRESGAPASLRRAVRFIEDNAQRAIGVREIAEAARMSPRGLQDLFHRRLGTTPTAMLRRVRLTGAREELCAGDAGATTVAEIARRWGFVQLSRFSAAYRAEYGENPRETLRA